MIEKPKAVNFIIFMLFLKEIKPNIVNIPIKGDIIKEISIDII